MATETRTTSIGEDVGVLLHRALLGVFVALTFAPMMLLALPWLAFCWLVSSLWRWSERAFAKPVPVVALDAAQVAILDLLKACRTFNEERSWEVKVTNHGKVRGASVTAEGEAHFNAAIESAAKALVRLDEGAPLRRELGALLQACRAFRSTFDESDYFTHENGDKETLKLICKAPQYDWRQACESAAKVLPQAQWRAPWPAGYSTY